jgi:hypothetical protein
MIDIQEGVGKGMKRAYDWDWESSLAHRISNTVYRAIRKTGGGTRAMGERKKRI